MKNQTFDFSVNLLQALLWRHNKAVNLTALLQAKQTWYDTNQTQFWTDWVTNVFDLRTANQFGLVVWAIILGVPLNILLDPDFTRKNIFGFKPFAYNFYKSNFGKLSQSVQPLTPDQQRLLLQIRYFKLISRATIPQMNAMLRYLFFANYGICYVTDNHDMTITYHFSFRLPGSLAYYLRTYDILPRPAGVSLSIVEP